MHTRGKTNQTIGKDAALKIFSRKEIAVLKDESTQRGLKEYYTDIVLVENAHDTCDFGGEEGTL